VTINAFSANVQAEDLTVDVSYAPTALSVDIVFEGEQYQVDLTMNDNVMSLDGVLDGEPVGAEITITENSVTGWAEFEGSRMEGSLVLDPEGNCSQYEFTIDGETESGCLEEEADDDDLEIAAWALSQFEGFEAPTVTLVTTRTDGEWYFSPLLSISNAVLTYLRGTDAETIARQIDQIEKLALMDSF